MQKQQHQSADQGKIDHALENELAAIEVEECA
jgi:hypothetical protein